MLQLRMKNWRKESKMNVLFLTGEAVPFIKTGGLADVAGALPKELVKKGVDCRVVLPLYKSIGEEFRLKMEKVTEFFVDLDWKHQYAGVYLSLIHI